MRTASESLCLLRRKRYAKIAAAAIATIVTGITIPPTSLTV